MHKSRVFFSLNAAFFSATNRNSFFAFLSTQKINVKRQILGKFTCFIDFYALSYSRWQVKQSWIPSFYFQAAVCYEVQRLIRIQLRFQNDCQFNLLTKSSAHVTAWLTLLNRHHRALPPASAEVPFCSPLSRAKPHSSSTISRWRAAAASIICRQLPLLTPSYYPPTSPPLYLLPPTL